MSEHTPDVWYRIEDGRYAPMCDEWGDPVGNGRAYVSTRTYPVIRETPRGVWLEIFPGYKRFVLRDARKRWACPTLEEAYESFHARKQRQRSILLAQLDHVEEALSLAGRPA